jgi:hypothetical protein
VDLSVLSNIYLRKKGLGMITAKRCMLLFFVFFSVLNAFGQAALTVSEYGAYFIDHGNVKKIPTVEYLTAPLFWRNYIVFHGAEGSFELLYNIENGALSDLLYTGNKSGYFPLETNSTNLLLYMGGLAYELDPVTLETVNKDTCTDYTIASDFVFWGQDVKETRIHERISRYDGENFYLVVTLTQNIDPSKTQTIQGGKKNQFVFTINDIDDGK